MKRYFTALVTSLALWAWPMTVGLTMVAGLSACGTLSGTGVYGKDKFLYSVDKSLAVSYDFLHSFVKWEYEQRANLAGWPEVTKGADYVRANSPKWFADAGSARGAYLAAKLVVTNATASASAQSSLRGALSIIQTESSNIARVIESVPVSGKPTLKQ